MFALLDRIMPLPPHPQASVEAWMCYELLKRARTYMIITCLLAAISVVCFAATVALGF